MPRKWNLLTIGTVIRIKGDKDIEGIITGYWENEGDIKGYRVKTDDRQRIIIDLDAEIEVIKR
jgi:hypothetical protein